MPFPANIDALLEACKQGFESTPQSECPYLPGSKEAQWWEYWRAKKQVEVQEEAA